MPILEWKQVSLPAQYPSPIVPASFHSLCSCGFSVANPTCSSGRGTLPMSGHPSIFSTTSPVVSHTGVARDGLRTPSAAGRIRKEAFAFLGTANLKACQLAVTGRHFAPRSWASQSNHNIRQYSLSPWIQMCLKPAYIGMFCSVLFSDLSVN